MSSRCPAPVPQVRRACSLLEASADPLSPCPVSCSDTIWLHVRSQGQWTNRLYESFKASDPVDSKRLSRSLRMRRSQRKPQVGCFRGGRVHCGVKPSGDQVADVLNGEHQSLSNGCIHWLNGSTGGEATVDSVIRQPTRPRTSRVPSPPLEARWTMEREGRLRSENPASTSLLQHLVTVRPCMSLRLLEL